METISEIIPFAKEMLNQRPSRSMLKIYMLGSTLAMLGVVGGLVETVLLPFVEQETVEDTPTEQITEKKKEKKQVLKSHTTLVRPEVVDSGASPFLPLDGSLNLNFKSQSLKVAVVAVSLNS
uniref:G0/G1 switch protein 2 n=1 Tax=Dicentrarchus labrax TaxID=13489 RepID=A0A8P4G2C2_DICLA